MVVVTQLHNSIILKDSIMKRVLLKSMKNDGKYWYVDHVLWLDTIPQTQFSSIKIS